MTKDEARATSLASRDTRSTYDVDAAGTTLAAVAWSDLVPGSTATCYLSMAGEPPTSGVIAALEAAGVRVALPIMRPKRQLAWGWHGGTLAKNNYGVLEPAADEAFDLRGVSAMLIPALRAGLDGSRLGRGAGYYDRALGSVPRHSHGGPLRIVIVFDDEVDGSVPHSELDAPVDVIVTPSSIVHVTASAK